MKNLNRYKGLVRLKTGGSYVSVECESLNPSQARKIINQTHNVKSWVQQPNKK